MKATDLYCLERDLWWNHHCSLKPGHLEHGIPHMFTDLDFIFKYFSFIHITAETNPEFEPLKEFEFKGVTVPEGHKIYLAGTEMFPYSLDKNKPVCVEWYFRTEEEIDYTIRYFRVNDETAAITLRIRTAAYTEAVLIHKTLKVNFTTEQLVDTEKGSILLKFIAIQVGVSIPNDAKIQMSARH